MSTRAQIRFATRETGVSFNEHPNAIHAQFYNHSDGYSWSEQESAAHLFPAYGRFKADIIAVGVGEWRPGSQGGSDRVAIL